MQVLLDVLHFGWPDHVDVFAMSFAETFGRFTSALVRFIKNGGYSCRMFVPVNEISFLSWAGGTAAALNPWTTDRGDELKRNLVRAAAVSSEILLNELPGVRLISAEPVIHIVGDPSISGDAANAERYTQSQFQAWDMLSGRMAPELGGKPEYLDIVGVNFYERNEWVNNSEPLRRNDKRFRPFHKILEEVWNRYRRPMFVSETGTEDEARAEWFNYVCDEVATALQLSIPIHGICLYPILNHPGWDDDRHCNNGLFDYADEAGNRDIHWPLANAIRNQQNRFTGTQELSNENQKPRSDLSLAPSLELCLPETSTSDEPFRADSESVLFRRARF